MNLNKKDKTLMSSFVIDTIENLKRLNYFELPFIVYCFVF